MTAEPPRADQRRRFGRSSAVWVTIGSLGSAGLTVIGFRVVGELAGAAALAEGVLTYGILLLATSLLAIPVSQAVGRYFFDVHTPEEQGVLFYSAILLIATAFGLLLLV